MNSSQFMDKQILDLMNPQQEERETTTKPHHISTSTSNGEGGGIGKSRDDMLPSYDFQPIRAVASSPPSAGGGGSGSGSGSGSAWGSLDSRIGSSNSNLRSAGVLEPQVMTEVKHKEERAAPGPNYGAASIIEIDRTVKKYADTVLHALEGVSARLSQLENRTHHMESAVDDLRAVVGDFSGSNDGKLRHFENILREVKSGVEILRDKQEIVETQLQLSKFQPPSKSSSDTPDTSTSLPPSQHPPPPQAPLPAIQTLALPGPNAPPPPLPPQGLSNAPPPALPQYPPQIPQSAPSVPPYFPSQPSQPTPVVDTTHQVPSQYPPQQGAFPQQVPPQYPPYTNPAQPQPQPEETNAPPAPTYIQQSLPPNAQTYPPRGPSNAAPPPPPPYMQLQQPSGHSPPSSSFYNGLPPMYNEPPHPPNRPTYGPPVDPYPYGGGSPSYRAGGGMKPNSPFTSGSLPTAKVLPQVGPVGSGSSGPGSGNRVPLDDVVEKVAMMGFSREQVRATVRRLTDNGQNVDLNVVLDKLMNDGDIIQPQKGWFNR